MSIRVPPPPEPEKRGPLPSEMGGATPKSKLQLASPLDPGFMGRVYVSTLWMGLIFTACAWGVTQSAEGTGSFAGGLLLGTLLLKSQELFVRRVLAPRAGVIEDGEALKKDLVARVPIALLLPFKYLVIGLAFWFVIERDWLHPMAFAAGFLTQQVVIVSKVLGRFLAGQMRRNESEQKNSVVDKNNKSHVAF